MNMTSSVASSILYWLVLLVYVFAVSSGLYLLFWIASRLWKKDVTLMPPEYTISNATSEGLRRRMTDGVWPDLMRWTVRLAVVTSVFIIGYATRDLQSYRHTSIKSDVRILRHDQGNKYLVTIADNPDTYEVKIGCPDRQSIDEFDSGMTLAVLSVEDLGYCWYVRSYKLRRDHRGEIERKEVAANVR